jgi:beta-galactosidase/beta-glucuronidase
MIKSFLLLIGCLIISSTVASSSEVIGDAFLSLNSVSVSWSVTNGTTTVPGKVPGDLITDLELGGVIGDPLYELNFKAKDWDICTWNYTTTFTLDTTFTGAAQYLLVFEGIKMVADVSLNGNVLGYTQDQFLRYVFDATAALNNGGAGAQKLIVSFPTGADQRNAEQRWMSCR